MLLTVYVCVHPQAFEVSVPVGGGRGSSRKITYTNPYTSSRTFLLRSDHPDLLQFKEDKVQVRKDKTGQSLHFHLESNYSLTLNQTNSCQGISLLFNKGLSSLSKDLKIPYYSW